MTTSKLLQLASFLFLTSILLIACGKEFDRFTPLSTDLDIDDLLELFAEDASTYAIDCDFEEVVVTPLGNVFVIPANVFQTKDGVTVSGAVDLQIKEVVSKGDMFLNGVPTVSDGRLLDSDGVFNIKAFQNEEELELISGKQIELKSPNDNPDNEMQIFNGNGETVDQFNWTLNPVIENRPTLQLNEWGIETDSLGPIFGFGYDCILDSLDWINIDAIKDFVGEETTGVTVDLPENYNASNTLVALIFKDLDSVVALGYNEETNQFYESYELVPVGYELSIVVLSIQADESLHFAIEEVTITQDFTIEMTPVETTIEMIKEVLGNL